MDDVPILFSQSQMKNLGMTIELDPNGDKITCPAFGFYSSPAEYSTMGHIMLDLTSLAHHRKSREQSARMKKHVIFCPIGAKSAYPVHTRELDEDKDDTPLVKPSSQEKAPKRESYAIRKVPTPL